MNQTVRCLFLLALSGCGDFQFVDSLAPEKAHAVPVLVQVIYSANENVSALFWKQLGLLPSDIGHYEVGIDGVYADFSTLAQPVASHDPLPTFAVLAPGKVTFALRMQVREGSTDFAVPAAVVKNLSVTAGFTNDDSTVNVTPIDPFSSFAGGGIVRTFSADLRDSTCTRSLQSASRAGAIAIAAPADLTDDGNYCVSLTSHDATFTLPIQTVPLVNDISFSYAIATIATANIIVPVWNFNQPDSDACASLLATVSAAIAAPRDATIVAPINVATQSGAQCQPQSAPSFDLGLVQDQVAPLVTGSAATPAVLFVLASNVDAPIAASLQSALQGAVIWAEEQGAISDVAILGTDNLTGSYFNPVRTAAWTYAADPALPGTLSKLVTDVLPYQGFDLEPETTLSFFSTPPPPNAFGFKLCNSNVALSIDGDTSGAYFPLPQTPGTYHATETQPFVPNYAFAAGAVSGTVEVCTRYCNRNAAGAWDQSFQCEGAR